MAETILIKCCGFLVHSKPNNMTLSAFPKKYLKLKKKKKKKFCLSPNVAPKTTDRSRQIRYVGFSCKYLEPFVSLVFPPPLKLRVFHIRKN